MTTIFFQSGFADEVKFNNGNVITGKIVHLTDGKLVFKSDIAGEITIALSKIQTLSTDEPVTVNLKNSTGFTRRLFSAQAGSFSIQGNDGTMQEIPLVGILSINPPAKTAPKWTGNLSLGITSTHGNTKTESVTGSANASKRREKDRTTLSADYAKSTKKNDITGDDDTIENWWRARGKYDYFFSKKMYGYLDARYEKDDVAELDRRIIVGAGGGYQWVESDDMHFSTELGLAYVNEKYDTERDDSLSAQLGYHFDKKLRKNVIFINDLTYYPSLEKVSDYYMTTTAEIRANFTSSFFTNFKTIFNYDSTPAEGKHKTDVKYFLGLGYTF
ncbi:MAG: DUF481 domain-containing protein [Sedimentisphaerales bacterium]|nr:DUF481 domain-containing protein [Sedimentisphaerales bacterium]